MAKELNKDTLNLDYDAPFRIMLEKYLPEILKKLLIENEGVAQAIGDAVSRQRKRMGK